MINEIGCGLPGELHFSHMLRTAARNIRENLLIH
jgi:hypothetical protein